MVDWLLFSSINGNKLENKSYLGYLGVYGLGLVFYYMLQDIQLSIH